MNRRRSAVLKSATVAGLLVFAAGVASLWPEHLVLDRAALFRGEVWRLWTGHLVHYTMGHFLLDVGAGAILLPWLRSWRAMLLLPPLVGLGVLCCRPDLSFYAGLSGVLHGWTVLVAIELIRSSRGLERLLAMGVLCGVLAKSLYETTTATAVFTTSVDMGGETIFTAHLLGALAGLVLFGLELPGTASSCSAQYTCRGADRAR